MKNIFLNLMFNILKNYRNYIMIFEKVKIEKVEKLVANLHDKTEYGINIRKLKQALYHRLVSEKKVHRGIKYNQNPWSNHIYLYKPKFKKRSKKWFWKILFQVDKWYSVWKNYGKCEKT